METKGKLRKVGNSYVVSIPMDLIKCKVLDPSKPILLKIEQNDQVTKGSFHSLVSDMTSSPIHRGVYFSPDRLLGVV